VFPFDTVILPGMGDISKLVGGRPAATADARVEADSCEATSVPSVALLTRPTSTTVIEPWTIVMVVVHTAARVRLTEAGVVCIVLELV
jgi:hypothetical protein